MSSRLAFSNVHAIYYDKDEDKTYIFGTHATDGFVGFCADGPVVELTEPQVILAKINEERFEELRQLKSIEETANGRKVEAAGVAAGAPANPVPEQKGPVGSGVLKLPDEGGGAFGQH